MPVNDESLRLLIDPPREGVSNMALDEAVLEYVSSGRGAPTLRLYRWSEPTISLGYFQPFAEYEALASPAGELSVVRRLTGGGAILHDWELTYSLALPVGHRLLERSTTALYGTMHEVIRRALARFDVKARRRGECVEDSFRRGPFFCFSRQHCEDLVVGEKKLVGSAQRRTRTGVLQHGSIILGSRYEQQECAVAGLAEDEDRIQAFADAFAEEFSEATGLTLEAGSRSDEEESRAGDLAVKYRSRDWMRRL